MNHARSEVHQSTGRYLSDCVGVRWPPVLEGEYIAAWVVGGAEEVAFAVLNLAPAL
jgi:hypothetical protein